MMAFRNFPIGASVTIEELSTNPHQVLANLRDQEPVSWIPVIDGWLVTNRDLCVAVMRDAEVFTVDDPRFSTSQVVGPSMLSLDGSEHQRHREPFVDPFRPGAVRGPLAEWTRLRAAELAAEIAPLGRGDLRAGIAAPLSVEVMAHVLDLEGVGVTQLLGWYEAIVASVHEVTAGADVPKAGKLAFEALGAAVVSNLANSSFLALVQSGETLSTDEIVSNVAILLFGGIVTSESTTASVFQHLLGNPGVMAEVRADRSLIVNAVEESMRLEPAAAVVDRYTTRSVDLGNVSIGSGELVRVSLTAANRDPSEFPKPHLFDLHRENVLHHLAFARGPHACLGLHLARIEARAAIDAALDRLAGIRLDTDRIQEPEGLVFRAPASVEAVWDTR